MEAYRKEFIRRMNKVSKGDKYYSISPYRYNDLNERELELLSLIYIENEIKMTFYEFKRKVFFQNVIKYSPETKKKSKYVRKRSHTKKNNTLHTIRKKEWKAKVNKKDERSKKRQFSYDDYERSENNRSYRRWVKRCIKQEDYYLDKGWKSYIHFRTDYFW
jgi:hypothetical protein